MSRPNMIPPVLNVVPDILPSEGSVARADSIESSS